jgi:hypothetical protein
MCDQPIGSGFGPSSDRFLVYIARDEITTQFVYTGAVTIVY